MYHATKILVAFIPSLDESSHGKRAYGFIISIFLSNLVVNKKLDRMLNHRFDA
jgi:hypothetical protein